MRQAGRALPEYRALKESYSFLKLVRTPELAAEVTLQPIRRFGFDAAVLFSDILIVPEALGQAYRFRDSGGIEMDRPIRSRENIEKLNVDDIPSRLHYVADALSHVDGALNGRAAMLGFAGSPWTLACFMVEGSGAGGDAPVAKLMYHNEPLLFGSLMEKITRAVIETLLMQIDAGAEAVQIFDSCGGALSANSYEECSGRWIREIVAAIADRVPVILYSKRTISSLPNMLKTGANVLSVDWTVSLPSLCGAIPDDVGVQGNLDPALLLASPDAVRSESRRILQEMAGRPGHIFNLGHGVLPHSQLENIEMLVETVRSYPHD
jgi:uroporphyrinogen decarboxylase